MKKGFTLIEILVSMGVLVVILTTVVGIMLNSLGSSRKMALEGTLGSNGNWAISEIRKNVMRASGATISCPVGIGSSITFNSTVDGETTSIICEEEGQIASVSAGQRVDWLESGVVAIGCGSFVGCSLPPTVSFPVVEFKFSLQAGKSGLDVRDFASQDFNANMVIRN